MSVHTLKTGAEYIYLRSPSRRRRERTTAMPRYPGTPKHPPRKAKVCLPPDLRRLIYRLWNLTSLRAFMADTAPKPAASIIRRTRRPALQLKILALILGFSSLLLLPFMLGPPRVYFPFEHDSIPSSNAFRHRISNFRSRAKKSLRIARINALTQNGIY